jgi:hypothetical protein
MAATQEVYVQQKVDLQQTEKRLETIASNKAQFLKDVESVNPAATALDASVG